MTDLTGYSTEALLDAVIRLTHMIASATDSRVADTYRARRDAARAEIVRRCS